MESSVRPPTDGSSLNGLRRHAGRLYAFALVAPLLAGGLLVWQAAELAGVLDGAIVGGAAPSALLPGLVLIAGLILVRILVGAAGERVADHAAERIKLWLRAHLMAGLLARSPVWTDRRSSGASRRRNRPAR
jgi:ATP-binding cassette subfamily C protein CydD